MKPLRSLFTLLLLTALSASAEESTIPLAGTWRFGLDPKSQGVAEEWFNRALVVIPPSSLLGPDVVREASGPLQNALPGSFMPTFWSLGLFGQIGTLGLLCNTEHPALAQFPTEKHSDWQWADLIGRFSGAYSFHRAYAANRFVTDFKRIAGDVYDRSKVIVLDETPADFRPIVQVMDGGIGYMAR